ncbi:DNA repair protein RadC [Snodgrassella alvi wkB2]|uniref:JAB domain-containing protein n=1 Tax=Snodgrassella alvi TaxID=1196083 RepID=A0ABD7Z071_9NEIS|nr:JAB domain-containing protein [Snodgrassella alvi]AHN28583.1 DNA repair protein RadC [Snodgrassella alvi wkB2]UOO98334.1 JAB domain-containing protein [Snodgrassella alvi wkB2]WLS97712.1 JAB domain-containing protein [Snodgrassella alvi]
MDIKLGKNDKRYIEGSDDVFSIMQRVLLRENKIDKEKEHFWIIGMNEAGYILYIELIALGSVKAVNIEPMNVYRVAVMKNATRVIAIHNHPSGRLVPSKADLDITDRLIQVGRILNITLVDHLIISTEAYESFRSMGIMDDLEKSLTYVPTYQVVEQIRKEEKKIAREKLALERDKTKLAKEAEKLAQIQAKALANALLDKGVDLKTIAKIMEITPKAVEKMINNTQ